MATRTTTAAAKKTTPTTGTKATTNGANLLARYETTSHAFSSLRTPTRLAILSTVASGPMTGGAIGNGLKMSDTVLRDELTEMCGAGILRSEPKGPGVQYWITDYGRSFWDFARQLIG